jgi:hypothetical protein
LLQFHRLRRRCWAGARMPIEVAGPSCAQLRWVDFARAVPCSTCTARQPERVRALRPAEQM